MLADAGMFRPRDSRRSPPGAMRSRGWRLLRASSSTPRARFARPTRRWRRCDEARSARWVREDCLAEDRARAAALRARRLANLDQRLAEYAALEAKLDALGAQREASLFRALAHARFAQVAHVH